MTPNLNLCFVVIAAVLAAFAFVPIYVIISADDPPSTAGAEYLASPTSSLSPTLTSSTSKRLPSLLVIPQGVPLRVMPMESLRGWNFALASSYVIMLAMSLARSSWLPAPLLIGLLTVPTASAVLVASGTPPNGCTTAATSTSLGAYCVGGSGPPYGLSRFNFANLTWNILPATTTAGTAFPSSGPLVFFETARVYNELCNCIVKTSHVPSLSPGALAPPSQWYGSDAGLLFPVHGPSPEQTEWHFADAMTFPNTTANFTVVWRSIGNVPWETRSCAAGTNPPFQYWFESRADTDTPFQISKLCFRESIGRSIFTMETASWSRSRGWMIISKAKYNTPSLTVYLSAPLDKPLVASDSAVPSIVVPMSGGNNAAFSARIGITYNYCSSCSTTPYCTSSECYCAGSCAQASTTSSIYLAFPKFATPPSSYMSQPVVFSPGPSSMFFYSSAYNSFYYESFPATESILGTASTLLTAPVSRLALNTYTPFNATAWRLAVSRSCGPPMAPAGGAPFFWRTANPILNFSVPIAISGLYFVCVSEDSGATWAPSISLTVVPAPVPPSATALTVQPTYIRTSLCASTYKVRFLGARVSASVFPNRVSLGAPCGSYYSAPVDVDDQVFPAWPLPPDPPLALPACYSTDNGTTWVQQQAVLYVVPSGEGVINTALSLSPTSMNPPLTGALFLTIMAVTASPTWAPNLYVATLIRTLPIVGAELICPGPRPAVPIVSGVIGFPTPPSLGVYTLCTSLDRGATWTLQPSATVTLTSAPLADMLRSIDPPETPTGADSVSSFFGLGPAFLTLLPSSSGAMSGALHLTLPTLVSVGCLINSNKTFEVVSYNPALTVPVLPVGDHPVCISTDQGVTWVRQTVVYRVVPPTVDPTPSPLAVPSLVNITPSSVVLDPGSVLLITVIGQGFSVDVGSLTVTWNGSTCTNVTIISPSLPVVITFPIPALSAPVSLNATLTVGFRTPVIVGPQGKIISSGGPATLVTSHPFAYQVRLTPVGLATTAAGLVRLSERPTAIWFSLARDVTVRASVLNAAGEPSRAIFLGGGEGTSAINITFSADLLAQIGLKPPDGDVCTPAPSSQRCLAVRSSGRASGILRFDVVRGDSALVSLPDPLALDFAPLSQLIVSWISDVTATGSLACPWVARGSVGIALRVTPWPEQLTSFSVSYSIGGSASSPIPWPTLFTEAVPNGVFPSIPIPNRSRSEISLNVSNSSHLAIVLPRGGLTVCSSKVVRLTLPQEGRVPVRFEGYFELLLEDSPANGSLIVTFSVARRGYSSCTTGCTVISKPVVIFSAGGSLAALVPFVAPDSAAIDDISIALSGSAADEYFVVQPRATLAIGGAVTVSQWRGLCGVSDSTLIPFFPVSVNISFAPPPDTFLSVQPVPSDPRVVFTPAIVTFSGGDLSLNRAVQLSWPQGGPTPPPGLTVTFAMLGNASSAFTLQTISWSLHLGPVLEVLCDNVYRGNETRARSGASILAKVAWFQPPWLPTPTRVTFDPLSSTADGRPVRGVVSLSNNAIFPVVGQLRTERNVTVFLNASAPRQRYVITFRTSESVKLVPYTAEIDLDSCPPGRSPSQDGVNACIECPAGSYSVRGTSCRPCDLGQRSPVGSNSSGACTCTMGRVNTRGSMVRPCMACPPETFWASSASDCKPCGLWIVPAVIAALLIAASVLYGAARKTHSLAWTYFELSVQCTQLMGLLAVISPWSELGSIFAVLNLDLRVTWLPCLIRHPLAYYFVRASPPTVALGAAFAMEVRKRRRNAQYAALQDLKLISPTRYARVVWFFAVPVAVWALEAADCVRDPARAVAAEDGVAQGYPRTYLRFAPSVACSLEDGRWIFMIVAAVVVFTAVCLCFPLLALRKAWRKRDPVKLWAVVWYFLRLCMVANAFAFAPRDSGQECLTFSAVRPPSKCFFPLLAVGVAAPFWSVLLALRLKVWGGQVLPYLGLSALNICYVLVLSTPPKFYLGVAMTVTGLVGALLTFAVFAVHATVAHHREAERRRERDIQEAHEEDESNFQFLMPRAILRDILEPREDDSLLFGASFPAGPTSAAARDSLHPCHGLLQVIKSELERAPADRALAWQPTLTRVALTHHRTLSRAFRQRLQLIADPKRVQLRRPWPEDGRGAERSVASRVLESHLARITAIATALGEIVDRRPSAGSRASAVSSGSAIELHVVSAPSPRIQSGGTSEHDPLGLVQLAAAGLDLVWHGPSGGVKAIDTICRTGFVNLATLNTGWHGRGLYFTHWAQYADYYFLCGGHRPENLTPQGEHALLLSWALVGAAYPVLARMDRVDDPEHLYHGGYPGYDSHYALVNDGGITCTEYLPTPQAKYDEVMISQESQVLPLAIVFFKLA